jgi:hypothetical protein
LIDNISKFKYELRTYFHEGGYNDGDFYIIANFKNRQCKYVYKGSHYFSRILWRTNKKHLFSFIEEIKGIDIFSWDKKYSDENVCDGGYWSITIKYNRNELYEIIGDNAYPKDFEDFFNILEKYFPIISIDKKYRIKINKTL